MHDYNTIFLVECQDKNGSLFHFVSFAQIQSIIYSRLTSKEISFNCAFFESLLSNEIVFFLPKSWSTLYVCLVSVTERAKFSTTKRQRLNSVLKVVREIINICTATRFFVSSADVPMLNLT